MRVLIFLLFFPLSQRLLSIRSGWHEALDGEGDGEREGGGGGVKAGGGGRGTRLSRLLSGNYFYRQFYYCLLVLLVRVRVL